ncbi:MAG: DUF3592 domain-containing protein [Lachnospiraceae bacterium]|nr:DUF3592 domain-containing protein [Lachnospiraceae bacterium]
MMPAVITILFAVIGIVLIVFDLLKRKRCSEKVRAECIAVNTSRSHDSNGRGKRTYNPTWEIEYNGRTITLGSNSYTSKYVAPGHHRTLRINPDNPEEFMDPSGGTLIIGIGFFVLGIIATVLVFTGTIQ